MILVDLPGHGESSDAGHRRPSGRGRAARRVQGLPGRAGPGPPARRRQLPRRPDRPRGRRRTATPAASPHCRRPGSGAPTPSFAYTRRIFTSAAALVERLGPRAEHLAHNRAGRGVDVQRADVAPDAGVPRPGAGRHPRVPLRHAGAAQAACRSHPVHRRDPRGRAGDDRLGRRATWCCRRGRPRWPAPCCRTPSTSRCAAPATSRCPTTRSAWRGSCCAAARRWPRVAPLTLVGRQLQPGANAPPPPESASLDWVRGRTDAAQHRHRPAPDRHRGRVRRRRDLAGVAARGPGPRAWPRPAGAAPWSRS